MIKKLAGIATLIITPLIMFTILLGGCEPKENYNTGKDGYRFEQEEKVSTKLNVDVVLVSSPQEMKRLYKEKTNTDLPTNLSLEAFAIIYPAAHNLCTLYMLDPRVSTYVPEFIGHEFAHCVFGNWHKTQDKIRKQS